MLGLYQKVSSDQYQTYYSEPLILPDSSLGAMALYNELTYKYRLKMQTLYHQHILSLRQLLPTYEFLKNNSKIECPGGSNDLLIELNSKNTDRMGTENDDKGKVKTKIFMGKDKETVEKIISGKRKCDNQFYKDGTPSSFTTSKEGDGTVPKESAKLNETTVSYPSEKEEKEGSHASLIDIYKCELVEFITGQKPSSCDSRKAAQDLEDLQGLITISVIGRAMPYVSDPSGMKTGINPDTFEQEDSISESAVSVTGEMSDIIIQNVSDGEYTLFLKDGYTEDFRLMFTYTDNEKTVQQTYSSFSHEKTVSFTFTVDSNSTDRIIINRTPAPPANLQADFADSKTRLSWNAVSGAVSYNVYSKQEDEPYLALIGITEALFYDTANEWAADSSVITRIYAVSAVKSDGTESFLSDMVMNNDRDHDGLDDETETSFGSEITKADTDGDQLTDGEEYYYGTTPTVKDTDNDGYSDYQEIRSGSDPLDKNSVPVKGDIDGDGDADLTDAVLTLQILANSDISLPIRIGNDVNEDGIIGLEEAVYILQKIAEIR